MHITTQLTILTNKPATTMLIAIIILSTIIVVIILITHKDKHPATDTPSLNNMSEIEKHTDVNIRKPDLFNDFEIDIQDIFKYNPAYQYYNGKSYEFILNLKTPLLGLFRKVEIRCFDDDYNITLQTYGIITPQFRSFINNVASIYGNDDINNGYLTTDDDNRLSEGLFVARCWTKKQPVIMIDVNLDPNEISISILGIKLNGHKPNFKQLQQAHPSFLGVPICGALDSFITKMEELGFQHIDDQKRNQTNYTTMIGQFGDNEQAHLTIYYTPQTHTIIKVAVFDDRFSTWRELKTKYMIYKKALQQKYGIEESYEFFQPPYHEGDGNEFEAIHEDKVSYLSLWAINGGTIGLRILNGLIAICYEDSTGVKLNETEEQQIINNYI